MKFTTKERQETQKAANITGIYKGYTKSFGFVITPDGEEDIYVAEENRCGAMNNDAVTVRFLPGTRKGKR